jgi:hypothetical protein
MQTITATTVHPTTGEIIHHVEKVETVELDNKHVAWRDYDWVYRVSCFEKGVDDVRTNSLRSVVTDIEYLECYACKKIMEFKECE